MNAFARTGLVVLSLMALAQAAVAQNQRVLPQGGSVPQVGFYSHFTGNGERIFGVIEGSIAERRCGRQRLPAELPRRLVYCASPCRRHGLCPSDHPRRQLGPYRDSRFPDVPGRRIYSEEPMNPPIPSPLRPPDQLRRFLHFLGFVPPSPPIRSASSGHLFDVLSRRAVS